VSSKKTHGYATVKLGLFLDDAYGMTESGISWKISSGSTYTVSKPNWDSKTCDDRRMHKKGRPQVKITTCTAPNYLEEVEKTSPGILWLLNCTKIIPGIYDLYLLNIYVFCMFPRTKTA